jgi:hypothetical protein
MCYKSKYRSFMIVLFVKLFANSIRRRACTQIGCFADSRKGNDAAVPTLFSSMTLRHRRINRWHGIPVADGMSLMMMMMQNIFLLIFNLYSLPASPSPFTRFGLAVPVMPDPATCQLALDSYIVAELLRIKAMFDCGDERDEFAIKKGQSLIYVESYRLLLVLMSRYDLISDFVLAISESRLGSSI